MAISLNYRGEIKSKEANATVQWLKQNNKVSFVEWCPTGFKIGLNDVPAALLPTKDKEDKDFPSSELDIMAGATKNCVMIGNNVAVSRVFTEPREDLGFLEKDYLDVVTDQASDEVNPDEEF